MFPNHVAILCIKTFVERWLNWYGHVMRRDDWKCWWRLYQGSGRENDRKQDEKTRANKTWKVLDWERVMRWTGRYGVERTSVILATIYEGKRQGERSCRSLYGACITDASFRDYHLPYNFLQLFGYTMLKHKSVVCRWSWASRRNHYLKTV